MSLDTASLFKELTLKDAEKALAADLDQLVDTIPNSSSSEKESFIRQMESFKELFKRYLHDKTEKFDWNVMEPIPPEKIKTYNALCVATDSEVIRQQLNKLVVVKLNGGLGTTMGCTGPKSLISVRNNLTFLDLTVQQIERLNNKYGSNIPLVLMNSFNTHAETEKVLRKYQQVNVQILTFLQSCYPRLNRESLLPIAKCASQQSQDLGKNASKDMNYNSEEWYPPGHGDFYRSFGCLWISRENDS
uniref:UTP--glucose-1-phosphate uridylyltransferase n=1 Tax=Schistosoma japonicum TaxID=6182 RepID=Q5D985_SCHJA|nr:SJCHGC01041 protein [Schistosoma japonicum]